MKTQFFPAAAMGSKDIGWLKKQILFQFQRLL